MSERKVLGMRVQVIEDWPPEIVALTDLRQMVAYNTVTGKFYQYPRRSDPNA